MLDLGASLSFVFFYFAMNFNVLLERLSEPFIALTHIGESIPTETFYLDGPFLIYHKSNMVDLVEIDMVYFYVILGMD